MRLRLVSLLVVMLWGGLSAAARPGPSGTFKGDSGQVKLKYLGEGTVSVELKTKYCALKTQEGGTFVFPDGIHVMNKKGEPVLVIFYQRASVLVYGELAAFKAGYCKGGHDATGRYKRAGK
jgi:hypothetical protein